MAEDNDKPLLRYSVSLVTQGRHRFYTLTMPSDVLARTCFVTTRYDDPKTGFQRLLDKDRAADIATYIDQGLGTIPSSVVLSAQAEAELKVIGGGKTIQFRDMRRSFLILDGQHRVFGFSLAKTSLRVPVVIYNGLSRRDESRLFIDINTKQRPVPSELLLDIKKLAEYETDAEKLMGEVYDLFSTDPNSPLLGQLSPSSRTKGKISRVTFNAGMRPLVEVFSDKDAKDVFDAVSAYLTAFLAGLERLNVGNAIVKPTVLRAAMVLFVEVARSVQLKHGAEYSIGNFCEVLDPMFRKARASTFTNPGPSPNKLSDAMSQMLKTSFKL